MTQALTRKNMHDEIDKLGPQFKMALPRHITLDRFKRVLFTAVQRDAKLARCEPTSVYAAMMRAAEQGLMPDGRQGALVPIAGKAEFWPMWQGLLDIARLSGCISDAYVASVREADEFDYELGFDRKLVHKPAMGNRGEILMVYCVVILPDGVKTFGPGPMTVEEVERIRAMAPSKNSPAWQDHWESMAWKTVLKRTLKYVPQSPELVTALEYDNGVIIDGEAVQATPQERSDTPTTRSDDDLTELRQKLEQHKQQQQEPEGESGPVPWQASDGRWCVHLSSGEVEYWDESIHSSGRDEQGRPKINKSGGFRRRRSIEKVQHQALESGPDTPENENQDTPEQPEWQTIIQYLESAESLDAIHRIAAVSSSCRWSVPTQTAVGSHLVIQLVRPDRSSS